MPFYQDILTGDILLEDIFSYKEVDSVMYEVQNATESVTLRSGDDSLVDFSLKYADTFGLEPITSAFSQKEFVSSVERYIDSLVSKLRDEGYPCSDTLKTRQTAMAFLNHQLLPHFDQYDLFRTPSATASPGMIVLRGFREDGVTPYFLLWKHGLMEMDERD